MTNELSFKDRLLLWKGCIIIPKSTLSSNAEFIQWPSWNYKNAFIVVAKNGLRDWTICSFFQEMSNFKEQRSWVTIFLMGSPTKGNVLHPNWLHQTLQWFLLAGYCWCNYQMARNLPTMKTTVEKTISISKELLTCFSFPNTIVITCF